MGGEVSEIAEQILVKTDIVFARRNGVDLKGNLFLPAQGNSLPMLITLPGGAWRQCNRRNHWAWGEYLAQRGYAVFTAEYRVATFERKAFPEAVQDVIDAIRFVRGNADGWRLAPDRIAILGSSAGAHLAALAALGDETDSFATTYPDDAYAAGSAKVKALVAIYGIYDLVAHWQDDLSNNPDVKGNVARNLLGADPFEDPRGYFDASPIHYVKYVQNWLPVLLAWGTHDDAVHPRQSELFLTALQQARFNVRAHRLIGANHWWFNETPELVGSESAQFAPRLVSFLSANL